MPRPLILAAALLLPLPAAAQLQPGFWSFPAAPGLPEAELAALCATGFSLVLADGGSQSFLPGAEGGPLWPDSEMACTPASRNSWTCEGWVDNGAGPEASRHTTSARFEDGALRLETVVEGRDAPVVTWPQPCPPAGIRAALALGMQPRG